MHIYIINKLFEKMMSMNKIFSSLRTVSYDIHSYAERFTDFCIFKLSFANSKIHFVTYYNPKLFKYSSTLSWHKSGETHSWEPCDTEIILIWLKNECTKGSIKTFSKYSQTLDVTSFLKLIKLK
jgi:hypothetical protein